MFSVFITWLSAHMPRGERGQDLIEYAMLCGLIAAAIVAVLTLGVLSGALEDMANGISDCIDFDAGSDCTGGL